MTCGDAEEADLSLARPTALLPAERTEAAEEGWRVGVAGNDMLAGGLGGIRYDEGKGLRILESQATVNGD